MNEKFFQTMRSRLIEMQDDLARQDERGQQSQKTVELDQQAVGRLSRMDAMQQQAMAKATQARRNQTALRISAALSRLDDGEFGYCVQCGEELDVGRLQADPTIPICLSCIKG